MHGVVLRRARRDDLPDILALYADDALSLDAPGADLARYEAAFAAIEAAPSTALYVATRDGRVVGTFQATDLVHLTSRAVLFESVHVRSSERGRGLGTFMMTRALEEARARGCTKAQLTSQKRRVDAHRFYERLGFARSHDGMKMRLC